MSLFNTSQGCKNENAQETSRRSFKIKVYPNKAFPVTYKANDISINVNNMLPLQSLSHLWDLESKGCLTLFNIRC